MIIHEGVNLAEVSESEYDKYVNGLHKINESVEAGRTPICVFISHKSCDKRIAEYIAKYIRSTLRMNVYLDKWDVLLQNATYSKDDNDIVKCIHKGLNVSTHLLCLLSEETENSWWVPYEIGYANKSRLSIATVKLANVIEVPSYLKINTYIQTARELAVWIDRLPVYRSLLESAQHSNSLEEKLREFFN